MASVILASASPRRRELLDQIGVSHSVYPVDIDESPRADETPSELVLRLAKEKAQAAAEQLNDNMAVILAADTIIEFAGKPLGKPVDEADGVATLLALSNNTHVVRTAFCIRHGEQQWSEIVSSHIQFGEITQAQAQDYWRTGEPQDKAGSYGIQGRGAVFVKHLQGSYSAVVGLPLYECSQALKKCGVSL